MTTFNAKNNLFIIALFLLIGLLACQSATTKKEEKDIATHSLLAETIKNLPDTILSSSKMKENIFKADLSKIKIDAKKTALLNGKWIIDNGKIELFDINFQAKNKVIFRNNTSSVMSGWGKIVYNRIAKFYLSQSVSRCYEYYIVDENTLILTQYNYRNNDLSIKKKPKAIQQALNLDFIDDNNIALNIGTQRIKLIKEID